MPDAGGIPKSETVNSATALDFMNIPPKKLSKSAGKSEIAGES
jgi:hypothetical protein